jgi:hypothetical protein
MLKEERKATKQGRWNAQSKRGGKALKRKGGNESSKKKCPGSVIASPAPLYSHLYSNRSCRRSCWNGRHPSSCLC